MRTINPQQTGERAARRGPRPFPATSRVELPESRGYRLKKQAARAAAPHRGARERAARDPDRARGVLVRLHLVVGVRDRGDPAPPAALHRGRRVQLRRRRSRSRCSVVLGFLILSYRETIKAYPTAGGAYMVTRDNFGILPAQVAGVSLLTDYILTVAVSVAAGTAALIVRVPGVRAVRGSDLARRSSPSIAITNLKGVRESGKLFAVPTYFFIVVMGVMLLIGFYKMGPATSHHRTRCQGDDQADEAGHAATGSSTAQVCPRCCTRSRPVVPRSPGRGDLQRRDRVQEARVAQRPHDPRDHGRDPRRCCSSGCRSLPRTSTPVPYESGYADRDLADRQDGVRHERGRHRAVLRAAGRHDADPRARGEHQLRRLPAARFVPRRATTSCPGS